MAKVYNNQIRITYHTLHRVLSTLGFVRRKTPGFIAYREANHNALILLPLMSDDTVVSDPHLMAVSNTIIGKRVATQQRLQSLLLNDSGDNNHTYVFPRSRAKTIGTREQTAKSKRLLIAKCIKNKQGQSQTGSGKIVYEAVDPVTPPLQASAGGTKSHSTLSKRPAEMEEGVATTNLV